MLGIVTLVVAIGLEATLFVLRIVKRDHLPRLTLAVNIAAFCTLSALLAAGVYWWGFRWAGLILLLTIRVVLGAAYFLKPWHQKRVNRVGHTARSFVGRIALLAFAILPGALFPQYTPVSPTGPFQVHTAVYTYVDASRIDPFSDMNEARKVTVQFWYPDVVKGPRYPLLIFSPGAFSYRDTNLSTFQNLASNGYVVCSIDHTHHAFITRDAGGGVTPIDLNYLRDAWKVANGQYDARKTNDIIHGWLRLRVGDMKLVLDEVLRRGRGGSSGDLYAIIDPEKIGVFGHSLGGATAAEMGRERCDVDAVMVLDGPMYGEEFGFEIGASGYPIPLLNLYSESHYDALRAGGRYVNDSASTSAPEAWNVVIRDSGHLNFTDLPLLSPFLARHLGTGSVDSRYCIETMNRLALDYFNYELKGAERPNFHSAY